MNMFTAERKQNKGAKEAGTRRIGHANPVRRHIHGVGLFLLLTFC